MNSPALIIETNDWTVVYLRGKKYIEDHELQPLEWIQLGITIREMGIQDLKLIKNIFIAENDVTIEETLWSFPDRVEELHNEIKKIINERAL